MKRSEINQAIRKMEQLCAAHQFLLPPFAHRPPDEWAPKPEESVHLRRAQLGWDVTDYGSQDFAGCGLTAFTLRNGVPADPGTKPYCEKLMLVQEKQVTPKHFHEQKTEDIINRGGGQLVIQVFATKGGRVDEQGSVKLVRDGKRVELKSGAEFVLAPGESVTFKPHVAHTFWAQPGHGPVLAGEVSTVNDDEQDNRFLEEVSRFPQIEENELPYRLLCNEYPG